MAQRGTLPLSDADFYLALARARESFRSWGHNWDRMVPCARVGIDELREIRDSKRLPTGVRKLEARIVKCLSKQMRRARERSGYYQDNDPLLRKEPLGERYNRWVQGLARQEFLRCDHRRGASTKITVVRTGAPKVRGGWNEYSKQGEYRVKLPSSWRREVFNLGFARVASESAPAVKHCNRKPTRFVLTVRPADPIQDGEAAAYVATWIERGRGFELKVVGGLLVSAMDGTTPPFLIECPFDGFEYDLAPAYKRAPKLLRARLYAAHKRARKAVPRG
jgi:hypothetical protein